MLNFSFTYFAFVLLFNRNRKLTALEFWKQFSWRSLKHNAVWIHFCWCTYINKNKKNKQIQWSIEFSNSRFLRNASCVTPKEVYFFCYWNIKLRYLCSLNISILEKFDPRTCSATLKRRINCVLDKNGQPQLFSAPFRLGIVSVLIANAGVLNLALYPFIVIVGLGHREEVTDGEAYCTGEEPENQSVEEHKSVILHLLSQLKLGMDLTKVPSGTFLYRLRELFEPVVFGQRRC